MATNQSNSNLSSGAVYFANRDFLMTLYCVISITSVIGNGLVFAAFFKSEKIRNSRTNYLIFSLSCADAVAACLAMPLYTYFVAIYFKGYNESPAYFIYQFTDVFSTTASIWHLAFISLERYFAIVWPVLHHVAKPKTYYIVIFLIWTVSLLSGGLSLELYKLGIKYIIVNSASLFGLPLTTIVFCYLSILRTTLRRSYVTSRKHFERELKVSFTIVILIALFIACWAPFFILGIISATCFCIGMSPVLYFKALHFGASCVNPIVYAARIPDFRAAFAKMLPKQIISFVLILVNRKQQESPPSSRVRTSSTLSSTLQSLDPSKRRPTLLENKAAVDQLSLTTAAKDSSHASSVNSNKYSTFLSDSPSSPPNLRMTKV